MWVREETDKPFRCPHAEWETSQGAGLRERGVWPGTSMWTCAGPHKYQGCSWLFSTLLCFLHSRCFSLSEMCHLVFLTPPNGTANSEGARALGCRAASPQGSLHLLGKGWGMGVVRLSQQERALKSLLFKRPILQMSTLRPREEEGFGQGYPGGM